MTRNMSRPNRISALLAASLALAAAAPDPIIAERGRDQITLGQARAMVAGLDADARKKLTATPAAMTDFLRNILVQRAVLEEAQSVRWDQRADVASLIARARDQVIAQTFLAAHATPPTTYPSDAELQAAYTANKAQFMQPRAYHLAQIYTVKPPTGTNEDGRAKLAALRPQIERGRIAMADAPKHDPSLQYGDMGWVGDNQLVPAVRDAVSGLLEGALTAPVCVENGCHLLRLIATRPAGPTPLADLRDGLVRALRSQKQAELERAYASTLLTKQPAEINEIEVSRLVQ